MAVYSIGLTGVIAFAGWQLSRTIVLGEQARADQAAGTDTDEQWVRFDAQTAVFYGWCRHSAAGIVLSTWLGFALTAASRSNR